MLRLYLLGLIALIPVILFLGCGAPQSDCHEAVQDTYTSVLALIMSCNATDLEITRSLQSDTTPPYFTDLVFPTSTSTVEEGELFISGTLVDDMGFHPDEPVVLEFETILNVSPMQTYPLTYKMVLNSGDTYDSFYFDDQTGEFEFNYGDEHRLKNGMFLIRLIGKDSSGNESTPLESIIISTPIDGDDTNSLPDAREAYGQNLHAIFSALIQSLEVYGNDYDDDIEVYEAFNDFIEETYINKPDQIFYWAEVAEDFAGTIDQIGYPDNDIATLLSYGAADLQEMLEEKLDFAAMPWYPKDMSALDILDTKDLIVDSYSSDLSITGNGGLGGYYEYDISFDARVPFEDEIQTVIDVSIVADSGEDLDITGYIGEPDFYFTISPGDYDPPVLLLSLFEESGLSYLLLKLH